jgi:hypothetical protein
MLAKQNIAGKILMVARYRVGAIITKITALCLSNIIPTTVVIKVKP